MVSGKNSRAVRNARAAVVTKRSTPWGLITASLVVLLVAVAFIGYPLYLNFQAGAKKSALTAFAPTPEKQDPSTGIPGVQVIAYKGGQHVGPTVQISYTHSPPFGGAHDFAWAACNGVVYPQAVRTENMVHSMEHGAVWVAYNPDQVTGPALDALAKRVNNQPFTLMSPYPGLDQPISVQSWGHQLKLADANDTRIDQFITALRTNQYQYPEPGARCDELGPGTFSQDDPPPFAPAPAPGTPGAQAEDSPDAAVVPDAQGATG